MAGFPMIDHPRQNAYKWRKGSKLPNARYVNVTDGRLIDRS